MTSAKRSGDPTKSLFLCTALVIPLYPVLPVHSNEIENAVEKKSNLPFAAVSFLPTFHSPLIRPLGKLVYMAIDTL